MKTFEELGNIYDAALKRAMEYLPPLDNKEHYCTITLPVPEFSASKSEEDNKETIEIVFEKDIINQVVIGWKAYNKGK